MNAANKVYALIASLGLWAGIILWQWVTVEEPVRVPLTNVSGPAASAQAARGNSASLRVDLDKLAAARTQREATFTAPRNIFAPPRTDGAIPIGQSNFELDAGVPNVDQPAQQQEAFDDLTQYRYLGYLRLGRDGARNREMAVLTKDEEVHVVRAGETIEDHVVVKAITPEGVTLQEVGSRLEQTVPLAEEAPPEP